MGKNYPLKVSIDGSSMFAMVYPTNAHKQEGKEYIRKKRIVPPIIPLKKGDIYFKIYFYKWGVDLQ